MNAKRFICIILKLKINQFSYLVFLFVLFSCFFININNVTCSSNNATNKNKNIDEFSIDYDLNCEANTEIPLSHKLYCTNTNSNNYITTDRDVFKQKCNDEQTKIIYIKNGLTDSHLNRIFIFDFTSLSGLVHLNLFNLNDDSGKPVVVNFISKNDQAITFRILNIPKNIHFLLSNKCSLEFILLSNKTDTNGSVRVLSIPINNQKNFYSNFTLNYLKQERIISSLNNLTSDDIGFYFAKLCHISYLNLYLSNQKDSELRMEVMQNINQDPITKCETLSQASASSSSSNSNEDDYFLLNVNSYYDCVNDDFINVYIKDCDTRLHSYNIILYLNKTSNNLLKLKNDIKFRVYSLKCNNLNVYSTNEVYNEYGEPIAYNKLIIQKNQTEIELKSFILNKFNLKSIFYIKSDHANYIELTFDDKDKDSNSIETFADVLLKKLEKTIFLDEFDRSLKFLIYDSVLMEYLNKMDLKLDKNEIHTTVNADHCKFNRFTNQTNSSVFLFNKNQQGDCYYFDSNYLYATIFFTTKSSRLRVYFSIGNIREPKSVDDYYDQISNWFNYEVLNSTINSTADYYNHRNFIDFNIYTIDEKILWDLDKCWLKKESQSLFRLQPECINLNELFADDELTLYPNINETKANRNFSYKNINNIYYKNNKYSYLFELNYLLNRTASFYILCNFTSSLMLQQQQQHASTGNVTSAIDVTLNLYKKIKYQSKTVLIGKFNDAKKYSTRNCTNNEDSSTTTVEMETTSTSLLITTESELKQNESKFHFTICLIIVFIVILVFIAILLVFIFCKRYRKYLKLNQQQQQSHTQQPNGDILLKPIDKPYLNGGSAVQSATTEMANEQKTSLLAKT